MDGIRQYVLGVICAAMICGMVTALVPEGMAKGILKLLSGVFLAVTVLSPLTGRDLGRELTELLPDTLEGKAIARRGEAMARETMAGLIKQQTETYILDKANSLHGNVGVEVILSEDPIPVPFSVVLTGSVPPYARKQLEQIIQGELGISKENLRWTG